MNIKTKTIHLASTQGFCAGVHTALEIIEMAIKQFGTPLYIRHHIVHNTTVIEDLIKRGIIFIENINEVPEGKKVILSAHGSAPSVYKEAKKRNITIIDATCPLVKKVHREAVSLSKKDTQVILIGHIGHQELIGTAGYIKPELLNIVETEEDIGALKLDTQKPIAYITQTTLSIDDTKSIINKLKEKYPTSQSPSKSDICFATQNRQDAIKKLTTTCDIIIVCGSPESSNSNRLKETAEKYGVKSYIIDTHKEFQIEWIENHTNIGISSGASVPQKVIDNLIKTIKNTYPKIKTSQEKSIEKSFLFPLPKLPKQ